MKNDFSKLHFRQEHAQETASQHHTKQKQEAREFASVEEIIRTDKQQIEVPPAVAERLNESILKEPPPQKKSWWKRMLGS